MHHIATGWDHLVFLFGLVLLSSSLARLVKIVTAFTIAHSLTLALAGTGLVVPPGELVERAIALTIAYVGLQSLRRKDHDHGVPLALFFGLVHGFGFAGALAQTLSDRMEPIGGHWLINLASFKPRNRGSSSPARGGFRAPASSCGARGVVRPGAPVRVGCGAARRGGLVRRPDAPPDRMIHPDAPDLDDPQVTGELLLLQRPGEARSLKPASTEAAQDSSASRASTVASRAASSSIRVWTCGIVARSAAMWVSSCASR
jgi:hypothetical protein